MFLTFSAYLGQMCLVFPVATIKFDTKRKHFCCLKHEHKMFLVSIPQIECKGFDKTIKTDDSFFLNWKNFCPHTSVPWSKGIQGN